jgi:hypothetical protein
MEDAFAWIPVWAKALCSPFGFPKQIILVLGENSPENRIAAGFSRRTADTLARMVEGNPLPVRRD